MIMQSGAHPGTEPAGLWQQAGSGEASSRYSEGSPGLGQASGRHRVTTRGHGTALGLIFRYSGSNWFALDGVGRDYLEGLALEVEGDADAKGSE